MQFIYSRKDPKKLLHIINRKSDIVSRTNVVPDEQFLQLATLKMEIGQTFKPHQHIWKQTKQKNIIAQESWIIVQGSVRVFMYDTDEVFLCEEIIFPGDCSITFEGGHTYEALEEDTIVYEYKTGPYTGQNNDKVFIKDHRK